MTEFHLKKFEGKILETILHNVQNPVYYFTVCFSEQSLPSKHIWYTFLKQVSYFLQLKVRQKYIYFIFYLDCS
jgi:hypothetical protein